MNRDALCADAKRGSGLCRAESGNYSPGPGQAAASGRSGTLLAIPSPYAEPSGRRRKRRRGRMSKFMRGLAAAGAMLGVLATGTAVQAQDTIKVGVLHSLSGTMASSETTLKDTVLMMVDDISKKGGLVGKKVEAVVVDPASNWPLFAEKARELLSKEKVAVVFGCWTSVSRKSVLPVFEELNGLLFYPVQYE